ncbi:MAG: hypothetical protein DMD83_16595, partial [Candidatus Rokuibacteriota bacterium]
MRDIHDEQKGGPARGCDQSRRGRPHQHCPGGDGDRRRDLRDALDLCRYRRARDGAQRHSEP